VTSAVGGIRVRAADLLDSLQAGVILLTRDGMIAHINPRLCEMLGRSADALVGRPVRELYEGDAEALREFDVSREPFDLPNEAEFFLPLPDGRRLPVMVAGRVPPDDSPLGAYRIVTVIDVSALKDAEARVRDQYEEVARLSDTVLEQALALKRHNRTLEERVRQRTRRLREAYMEAIYMLAVASEAKDEDTGAHVLRIRDYTEALAREIGLPPIRAERIGYSAILHDVGKMHVPDDILKKPGPLTDEERRIMQTHTVVGEQILSEKPFFDVARQIARSHQENWDGSGYPDGLKAEDIPLPARVVRLADVFDALTSERVYKPPWPPEEAIAEIRRSAGTMFEPRIVDAFVRLVESGTWAAIRERQPDARRFGED
jgi:PAS domain S-box-containing protein/putative nucleotidyltransferase with HDIG domain